MIAQNDVLEDINFELKNLTSDLSIGDRLETMVPKEAFVTVKDHKDNFEVNPTYRLIKPAKSELGKISKIVLDDINCQIKNIINVNQWKNSMSVIDGLRTLRTKIYTHSSPSTYMNSTLP